MNAEEKAIIKQFKRLNAIYNYTKEYIDEYIVAAKPTTESGFDAWEAKVNKFRGTSGPEGTDEEKDIKAFKNVEFELNGVRQKRGDAVQAEIDRLRTATKGKKGPGGPNFTKTADLAKAIVDEKENDIKKIYQEFDKLDDSTTPKKTNCLFDALDALIKELKKTEERDAPDTWKTT